MKIILIIAALVAGDYGILRGNKSINKFTNATTGCQCAHDQWSNDCPCCASDAACPCFWPYEDRCGDCVTGEGCVPTPMNKYTSKDRGCRCEKKNIKEIDAYKCACCAEQTDCQCPSPYEHMCMPCLDDKEAMAAQCKNNAPPNYQQFYPASFTEQVEETKEDGLSWSVECDKLGHEIENGFAFCNGTRAEEYSSCFWICADGFHLDGPQHANCECKNDNCSWNSDADFRAPACVKDNPQSNCRNGSHDGSRCICDAGWTGAYCHVPSNIPSSARRLQADSSELASFFTFRGESEVSHDLDRETRSRGEFSISTDDSSEKNLIMDQTDKKCPDLGTVEHGKIKCTKKNNAGSHCLLQCDQGFGPSDTKFMSPNCNCKNHRCRWDKRRNYKIASCFPNEGNSVSSAIIDEENSTGSEATGSDEYFNEPEVTTNAPKSNAGVLSTKCFELSEPNFGRVKCTDEANNGSTCRFSCKKGYALSNNQSAACKCTDGLCKWNEITFYKEPRCADRDECAIGNHSCKDDQVCINKPGSYACLPRDSPILRQCDSNPCGIGGSCKITPIGYKCICKPGFEYRQGTCKDVNECAMRVSKCFDDAICENNEGGYSCKCPSGFGDAISECVESRANLGCIQKRTLRFEPNPEHVAPNACCSGIAFHTDLKCCCRGVLHDLTSGRECPCLKIDYHTL